MKSTENSHLIDKVEGERGGRKGTGLSNWETSKTKNHPLGLYYLMELFWFWFCLLLLLLLSNQIKSISKQNDILFLKFLHWTPQS